MHSGVGMSVGLALGERVMAALISGNNLPDAARDLF